MDVRSARENMTEFDSQICLVGHTHIPGVYKMDGDAPKSVHLYNMPPGDSFSLTQKSIVNPGSVGQPRDHNPRSSYLIYDDDSNEWVYQRVDYDIEKVQERILALGLPQRHASRLTEGW